MLRAKIEIKMNELEILLNDLYAHKAQLELERGLKITKDKIIAFVALLLQGDPNDKEYQRKIIDNFVYMVYVYDDSIVTYFNMQGDKGIERISLADTDKAIDEGKSVQTLSSLVHHQEPLVSRNTNLGLFAISWAIYCQDMQFSGHF